MRECTCTDCGMPTLPKRPKNKNMATAEWYMVTDEIWAKAGMDEDGFLCLSCLTGRLSRPVQPDDLADLPINYPGLFDDTPQLFKLKALKFKDLLSPGSGSKQSFTGSSCQGAAMTLLLLLAESRPVRVPGLSTQ